MKGLNLECGMTRKRIFLFWNVVKKRHISEMRCGHILFFHVSMCCWWWNEMLSRLRWWWNLKCRKLQCKVAVFFECTWSNRSLHLWWTLSFEIVVNSNCNWLMISFIIFIFSTNNMPEPWDFFSPWNSEPTLFLSLSLSLSKAIRRKHVCRWNGLSEMDTFLQVTRQALKTEMHERIVMRARYNGKFWWILIRSTWWKQLWQYRSNTETILSTEVRKKAHFHVMRFGVWRIFLLKLFSKTNGSS